MEEHSLRDLKILGYYPGVLGLITQLHATYYHEHWGFDISFETQVGRELSLFMERFNPERDGLWVARVGDSFAGSIAIDGCEAGSEGARLRWFIVAPELQGTGIGKVLMQHALEFCRRRNYGTIYLWTFKGLEAARALYERNSFRLCEEHCVAQWGQTISEQKFQAELTD